MRAGIRSGSVRAAVVGVEGGEPGGSAFGGSEGGVADGAGEGSDGDSSRRVILSWRDSGKEARGSGDGGVSGRREGDLAKRDSVKRGLG